MHDPAAQLKDFRIARIVEATQHPNADRLRVCKVDTGAGELGAGRLRRAQCAHGAEERVLAAPGTYIPGKKITLGKGVIRGVESLGMLCSFEELELCDGTATASSNCPRTRRSATVYAQWAGLDDPVIEINLTPNRADAAGVHGIARDLAAAGLGVLKEKAILPVAGQIPLPCRREARSRARATSILRPSSRCASCAA